MGLFRNAYLRLAIGIAIAGGVAAGATLLGRDVVTPSVRICEEPMRYGTCSSYETEYDSYGWPIPWRTDAPSGFADAEVGDQHRVRPYGSGISSNGISRYALAFTVLLWFAAASGALVLIDAIVTRRWRNSKIIAKLATGFAVALGFAALVTILGTLVTSSGLWNGDVPYESAGWPIEWKTSPWIPYEGYGELEDFEFVQDYRYAARPFNMLGFSPLYLAHNVFACLGLLVAAGGVVFSVIIIADVMGWRTARRASEGADSAAW